MPAQDCHSCSWGMAEPDLGEAIVGIQACPNCEHEHPIDKEERYEIGASIEERMHVLEREFECRFPTVT